MRIIYEPETPHVYMRMRYMHTNGTVSWICNILHNIKHENYDVGVIQQLCGAIKSMANIVQRYRTFVCINEQ